MLEAVVLYSSTPLSWREINEVIQSVHGGSIWREGAKLLGSIRIGERYTTLYGDWEPQDSGQFGKKGDTLPEVEARLGKRPSTSLLLEEGRAYGSGLLTVELAYQFALHWPCVVWADTWDPVEGTHVSTVYTKEDMERLRGERRTFTSMVPIAADNGEES